VKSEKRELLTLKDCSYVINPPIDHVTLKKKRNLTLEKVFQIFTEPGVFLDRCSVWQDVSEDLIANC
jgi:hypothetical protein